MSSGDPPSVGKYRRIAELGRGGMANVYLAAVHGPQGFTKLVVLKEARDDLAEDPTFRRMFLDEARLAARLNHPNVVQTYEVGEDSGHQVIVMEYLEGQPLSRARKELPLPLGLFVLSNVLSGLEHAHDLVDYDGKPLRVVHRDVSPHNIFLTYSGEVKLVDFGIAKAADSTSNTTTGTLKGKLRYMAPEHARGEATDGRADLFSVGSVLWELATGGRLWTDLSDVAILSRLVMGEIPKIEDVAPSTPAPLRAILTKALALKPDDRYAKAAEMQADLDAYLATLGETPTRRALGGHLSRAFAAERAKIKTIIEDQLRAATLVASGDFRAVKLPMESVPSSVSFGGALSGVSESSASPSSAAAPDGGTATGIGTSTIDRSASQRHLEGRVTPSQIPPRGRARLYAGLFVTALALAIVGRALFSRSFDSAAAPSPSTSVASASNDLPPRVSDAADTSASPAPGGEGRSTRLVVRTIPLGASLFLDGEPIAIGADGVLRGAPGGKHRLRAEAPGYTPEEVPVSFEVDNTVTLHLTRARTGRPPPRPTGGKVVDPTGQPAPADSTPDIGY